MPNPLNPADTASYYQSSRAARRLALFIICLGTTIGPISLATVNIALPTIALDLGATAVLVAWMPTGFMLASLMVMLPMGKLADRYGRKRFFFSGVALTGLLSMIASTGQSMEMLLFLRMAQGVTMAMVMGSGLAIITAIFSASDRGSAMGIYAASMYTALTLSPFLGGWVTEHLGWRAVFWIQAPLAAIVIVLLLFGLKGEWRSPDKEPFDWTGSIIFAIWGATLVYGLAGLPKVSSIITLLISIPYFVLFLFHQARVKYPLIRLNMFRENRVFSLSLLASSLAYIANYPFFFLLSLFIQLAIGYSPTEAGKVLLVQTLVMALSSPLAGKLSDRFEARYISTLGACLMAVGFFLVSRVTTGMGAEGLLWGQVFLGLGMGLFSTPNTNAAMSSIDKKDLGIASASINLSRTMGNMLGMSLVSLLIYNMIGPNQFTSDQAEILTQTVHIWMYASMVFILISAGCSFARGKPAPVVP